MSKDNALPTPFLALLGRNGARLLAGELVEMHDRYSDRLEEIKSLRTDLHEAFAKTNRLGKLHLLRESLPAVLKDADEEVAHAERAWSVLGDVVKELTGTSVLDLRRVAQEGP